MDEHSKTASATGTAIGLSTVSAFIGLCCLGPWVVSIFGVTAGVAVARFEFLRPWILAVAALALGWAFWRVYLSRPRRRFSPWLKRSLWFAAGLTTLALFADQLQWWLVDPTPEALR
jgi:hypothetical protein